MRILVAPFLVLKILNRWNIGGRAGMSSSPIAGVSEPAKMKVRMTSWRGRTRHFIA